MPRSVYVAALILAMAMAGPAAQPIRRLLYVAVPGAGNENEYRGVGILVYDIDNGHALVKQFTIPEAGKRGVMVAPNRGFLYVSSCGTVVCSGMHGTLLAYDLVNDGVAWIVNYPFGVDQGAILPDESKIYMPHGDDARAIGPGLWRWRRE